MWYKITIKQSLNKTVFNSFLLAKEFQTQNWGILQRDAARKRVDRHFKRLESLDDERIIQWLHYPLEQFCQQICDEFSIHIIVLLSRQTQVIYIKKLN